MTRLLIVGWDAADWKVIDPLLKRGEMPHLSSLLAEGVRGNLATHYPPLSPMVWATIATGKRPPKHVIHGFTEPTEDGLAVRPISNLGRTTKALWNILNQEGKRSIVVGWWPSHPAEPIRGVMVSNHFPLETHDKPDRSLLPGTVSPPQQADCLADLRIHFTDIPGSVLANFVPEWQKVDQKKDRSLQDLAGIIAETASIHAAATELMQQEEWDLAAVYYTGIDHFSHRFMRYHAHKIKPAEDEPDPALFRDIVKNGYRYHDAMLGRLLQLAGPDCAVIVVSDHGFHSDRLLPDHIPAEAAGPAVEHRDFGVFCMKGPGVLKGKRIYGAGVGDVTPTALHLFGLPIGRDMDGKVLVNAFASQALPETIASWDEVAGEDGRHPPERQYDGAASVEALNQLVALGYIAAPGDDTTKTVRETVAENRYNLARAQLDAGRPDLAADILRELVADDPEQLRYQQHLFQCLLSRNALAECGRVLDAFDETCGGMARRAFAELEHRRDEKPDKDLIQDRRSPDRKEMFERRALAEKIGGYTVERLLLRCRLALAEIRKPGRKEAARALLERLADSRATRAAGAVPGRGLPARRRPCPRPRIRPPGAAQRPRELARAEPRNRHPQHRRPLRRGGRLRRRLARPRLFPAIAALPARGAAIEARQDRCGGAGILRLAVASPGHPAGAPAAGPDHAQAGQARRGRAAHCAGRIAARAREQSPRRRSAERTGCGRIRRGGGGVRAS
jgi:predicted AlkP superfamily phosphohydrolase/phosphomutase